MTSQLWLTRRSKRSHPAGISVEESNRVISGLRRMLHHYEDEAVLLSIDVLENQLHMNIRGNASAIGTGPPNEPSRGYHIPKVLTGEER
jgi:hypothetical protein